MGLKPKYQVEQIVGNESWAEPRDRFPEDTILRGNGFRIHSRTSGKDPIWVKDGEFYDHMSALQQCPEYMEKINARRPYEIKLKGGLGK